MTDPDLADRVLALLHCQRTSIAVAESLTGGLLGAQIVAIPGASAVFRGGVLAYASAAKTSVLGVDPDRLDRYGPVDPTVAVMMADGVRSLFDTDLALATTGVAGPGGADGHPAGTAFLARTGAGRPASVRGVHLAGDRRAVRAAVTQLALALLLP